jgi:hypothetical protein
VDSWLAYQGLSLPNTAARRPIRPEEKRATFPAPRRSRIYPERGRADQGTRLDGASVATVSSSCSATTPPVHSTLSLRSWAHFLFLEFYVETGK